MNPLFDINRQYRLYLERVELVGKIEGTVQDRELKKAFYGAFGQALVMLRDDLTQFPDAEAEKILVDMYKQVSDFWESQV